MKLLSPLKFVSICLILALAAACSAPQPPTITPNATLSPLELTQTFEAAVAESVQGTLEAITGYAQAEIVVNEPLRADEAGSFSVADGQGEPVSFILTSSTNEKVGGASILSAANREGVLVLVVPPAESSLQPQFTYVDQTQAQGAGRGQAAPARQEAITIHLGSGPDSPPVSELNVPPGLLEALFSSPGWQKSVTTAHSLCESLSTLSSLGSVAYMTYATARTVMATMSLKHLGQILLKESAGLAGVGLAEGFLQVCLAATGDPVGLRELTGVIHPGTGFGMIFLKDPLPVVVKGRVVDPRVNLPLQGAEISTPENQVSSLADGTFFFPVPANISVELSCRLDGFATEWLNLPPAAAGAADLGDIPLESVSLAFLEEFDNANAFFYTSGNVTVVDGRAAWSVSRSGGSQFIYRSIPAFSGDVRITVTGQVDDWTNNCRAGIGIGDDVGSGAAIYFGFFGGGCQTSGPVVTAGGASLDLSEMDCEFSPNWPWIQAKTPYTVVLTLHQNQADLEVSGIGNVSGSVDYSGEYTMLWVGLKGDGDWPACSGSFDSILVEPIP